MLEKREFCKTLIREERGEKLYIVQDKNDEVFVDRLFNEGDAQAVLNLVNQAYERGLKDMKNHVQDCIRLSN